MQRIPYTAVADAIASAEDEAGRQRAGALWEAYHAIQPAPETVRRRMELLYAALKRARDTMA